ncbi:ATP synthase F1 subunit delta [Dissulfurirhabdus thermomarina]|uniref:ATP synthase subunit delta n=1 Tax=Dissulfurirhabdus thermomarina TaxID=1765737 RepID=A0A6N9TPP6_DISTH|nr:ATP synthase F1 subunit delta [Dissulfurirhabdus thermomarina]NDY42073.1 ATP synthase F1 subunit delta [Dissulfurirhabdus thermomarina]NMX22823.1 ATP synthase F1 subunit delta [Dissulfurirhabdus thermomarina]
MISTVVARRYAKALFAIAKEEGTLEEMYRVLGEIHGFLADSPEVEAALSSPVLPMELKHKAVQEIIKAFGVQGTLARFLELLVDRRRIQHLGLIAECYQELMDEEMNVVRAVVRTAVPLPDDLKARVSEALARVSGKEVKLELREDPSVIAGVVAQIGDKVLDGSIASQLQGFKESIERGELG